jgi:hypothetical protein
MPASACVKEDRVREIGLVALSVLVLHAAPMGGSKSKSKHKTFQPIVKTDARAYAGHYVGIDSMFSVDVWTRENEPPTVLVHEGAMMSSLRDVRLEGARLTGTLTAPDGKRQRFEGVFGERGMDGRQAFGLLVNQAVQVADDVVLNRIFCKRQPQP